MTKLLEQVNSPDDLKKLSVGQLKSLAEQIRALILSSVSKTGGEIVRLATPRNVRLVLGKGRI